MNSFLQIPVDKIAIMIPIVAILGAFSVAIVSTVASQWRKAKQAELDVSLKSQMLDRGMSAEEIERVLSAKSPADE